MQRPLLTQRWILLLSAASALAANALAQRQVTFSIRDGSATSGVNDCAGNPINPASVLWSAVTTHKPLYNAPQPPCIAIPNFGPGSLGVGVGTPNVEVDALSYGDDDFLTQNPRPGSVWFSVDARSFGFPFAPVLGPSVQSEAGVADEAASMFIDTGLVITPAWAPFPRHNVEAIDGDGDPSGTGAQTPGVGAREPSLPGVGDDVDALDIGQPGQLVLFSLDAGFMDPCGGPLLGSAVANGFAPGAIIGKNMAGGAPFVWAPAAALGLDLAGPATDDLDALAVYDNGNHVYDASDTWMSWVGGNSDMVLFSVRRGSWVIGRPDSIHMQPIEEGDVLMPPLPGGLSPFPGIFIPAEQLGLATVRSGTAALCGNFLHGDDLDGLDVVAQPVYDCNGNGFEDALDVWNGGSNDANHNGKPDECECGTVVTYCTPGTSANGCAALISAVGAPSASAVNGFFLTATQVDGQQNGLFFYGVSGSQASPWGASSSFLCVKSPLERMTNTNAGGTLGACDGTISSDWSAYVAGHPGAVGVPFSAGTTVWAQLWYRDPPSVKTTAMSNALHFTLCP